MLLPLFLLFVVSCFLSTHLHFSFYFSTHSHLNALLYLFWKISWHFCTRKKKNLICSSHLRYSVSFSSLLCHWLPFTFQCSLIQFYDKMETALTKATKNLLIPTLSYLCSLLILQERLLHFGHSTFLCAFKVFSSLWVPYIQLSNSFPLLWSLCSVAFSGLSFSLFLGELVLLVPRGKQLIEWKLNPTKKC